MADKKIDIRLRSGFDPTGVNEASRAIDNLHDKLMASDKWLMQINAELARHMKDKARSVAIDYMSYADKTCNHAVLSAKQIEAAWRKAYLSAGDTKPLDNAKNGFGKLEAVARGVASGIGGAFRKVAGMFLQWGIWGAAAAAVTKAFTWAWDKIQEGAEKAAKRAERLFGESLSSISKDAAKLDKAFSSSVAGIDKAVSRVNELAESFKEATKAEIELAKQIAIANGMDPGEATAAAADLTARADFDAEEKRLKDVIALEEKRVKTAEDAEAQTAEFVAAATRKKEEAEAALAKKREEYVKRNAKEGYYMQGGMAGGVQYFKFSDEEIAKNRAAAAEEFDDTDAAAKLRENVRKAQDVLDSIKVDEKALDAAAAAKQKIADAEKALDVLAMKRESRDLEVQNEIAAEAKKDAEAQAEAARRAAEERSKAEVKAAQTAAKERERLQAELHQKRMADLKAEMDAQKEAASPLRATVAAAQSEFERAFAMYRSPEQAASQIAEERDRASDLKQLHKDASRYGGKWRIDELAGLMAAGDSAGVQSRLEDWRKSKSFTPEVEAMVRASAAEQTKTTAEDELRKLNDKTGELAQKIETLAQSRDGKLDGIERNTNQLANKLDELLQVKG